jgi:hypothetical protein
VEKSISEDENVPVRTHSDNTSILVPSSDGLIPTYRRTSAPVRWGRLTVDSVYTICGRSPRADRQAR